MKKVFLLLFVLLAVSTNAFAYWVMVRAYYWPDISTSIELNAHILIDNVDTGFLTPHQFEPIIEGTYTVQLEGYSNWIPTSAYVTPIEANGAVIFGTFYEENVPVTLSYLSAGILANYFVELHWTTQSESGVQGYHVLRSAENNLSSATVVSGLIPAANTSSQQNYTFVDEEILTEGTYFYWLLSSDYDGSDTYHGPISVDYSYHSDNPPAVPLFTDLKQIYPNPFNPLAYIPYSLASSASVDLLIYNSRGQLVRQFDQGEKEPGEYRVLWDGKDDSGVELATGVYFVRMHAGKEVHQRKAVLIK